MRKIKTLYPCRFAVSEVNWAEIRRLKRKLNLHSVDEVISHLLQYVGRP